MTRIYSTDGGPAVERNDDDWRLSGLYNDWLETHGEHTIIVRVGRGTAAGAPGAWWPHDRVIELDGRWAKPTRDSDLSPVTDLNLGNPADLATIAVLHGLFIHENAHATHTTLQPGELPDQAARSRWTVATMLEESRIEAAAVLEDPDNAMWLKAAVNALIEREQLGDITSALLLLSARSDAGVLDASELEHLTRTIIASIGDDSYRRLRAIWQEAQLVDDHETVRLLALADRWLAELHQQGIDPPADDHSGGGHGGEPCGAVTDTAADLAAAAGDAANRAAARAAVEIADAVAIAEEINEKHAGMRREQQQKQQAQADRRKAAEDAQKHAEEVFRSSHGFGTSGHRPAVARWREPTPRERAAAAKLARKLQRELWTPPTRSTVTTRQPGGKLNYRGAVALDAQKHLGLALTAKDWHTTRTTAHPPLKLAVGVALDRSGSMSQLVAATSQASWVIAAASRKIGARFAAVTFGEQTEAMCKPGAWPSGIPQIRADAGHETIGSATSALAGALPFDDPTYTRLLFLFSDGRWVHREEDRKGRANIARLAREGCHVILANSGPMANIPHTTQLRVQTATLCDTLAKYIVHAIKQAQQQPRRRATASNP